MGTFGSFTTVRLGIYAAQKGLDVTGNNITNINTEGYTRQRLNQVSLIASVNDRYSSSYNARIGQGAVIAGINQIRDPGLDISYRKANADVGSANAKLDGLNQLATILDEVGKGSLDQDDGVILSQLNDIRDLISEALTNGVDTYDPLIRSSAEALCTLFNSYADKLTELQSTYEEKLDQEVTEVNDILTQIRDLNESIRNADLRGDPGLELRDRRNALLDELSGYMKIDVKYDMEDVGAETYVERLTVTLATGDKQALIRGVYGAQFSLDDQLLVRNEDFPNQDTTNPYLDDQGNPVSDPKDAAKVDNTNYTLVLGPLLDGNGEKKVSTDFGSDIGDTDLYGSIQSLREILTEKGEFYTQDDLDMDPDASIKRGIPYYQKALDSLAYQFAMAMNDLNNIRDNNNNLVDGAGNLFSIGSDTDDAEQKDPITGDVIETITAANISVSKGWANQTVSIQAKSDPNAPSGDTSQLAKFLALFDEAQTFTPSDVAAGAQGDPYTGTFEDMLLKIQSTLAEDQMSTDAVLNNYTVTADNIYVDREGVSGVDLNDEATSLMTFQKAYSAACRLMTTLNTALDSLLAM